MADFATELAQYADVSVVAPGPTSRVDSCAGLTVYRYAAPEGALSQLKATRIAHWGAIARVLCSGTLALDRAMEARPVDHILAFWALPCGYWAQRAGKARGVPYSVWALGSDVWQLGGLPIVRGVLARVLRDATCCFADGLGLAHEVVRLSGRECRFLPSSRRLPVRGERRQRTAPPYRLAFLGRWHPNKGVDLMLQALRGLPDEVWSLIRDVRVCGGGILDTAVRHEISVLRAGGRPVQAGGYLDKQGAADLLESSDFLLLPSRIESIPVIFSDALQAGCPLVMTPVGDLPRLAAEEPVGVMARTVSAADFAQALREALTVGPARFASGIRRARVRFDLGTAVRNFLEFIRQIAA